MARITRRVFRALGAPASRQTVGDPLSAAFGTKVSELTQFYHQIVDIENLRKLSEGDPDSFLKYAKTRMDMLGATHPDYPIWQQLVKSAQSKVQENYWAEKIQQDPKNLEGFLGYLQSQLSSAAPGSNEAVGLLQSVDHVNKAILGRDSAVKDQAALMDYMKTGKEADYIQYLQTKMAGTTDPTTGQKVASQIQELQARETTKSTAQRGYQRLDTYAKFTNGEITYSQALSRLRDLARSDGITEPEINSIQSTISAVEARQRSSVSQGNAAVSLDQRRDVDSARNIYLSAKSAVDSQLARGESPTTAAMQRVHDAQQVYQNSLQKNGSATTNPTYQKQWMDEFYKLGPEVATLESKVDSVALKGADVSPAGQSTFQASLPVGVDAGSIQQRMKMIQDRMDGLQRAGNVYTTHGTSQQIQSYQHTLAGEQAKQIGSLMKAKPGADASEQLMLDSAFRRYRQDLNDNAENYSVAPLSRAAFDQTLKDAPDRTTFAYLLGADPNKLKLSGSKDLGLEDQMFGQLHDAANGGQPAKFNPSTFQYEGSNNAIANVKSAEEAALRLSAGGAFRGSGGMQSDSQLFEALPGMQPYANLGGGGLNPDQSSIGPQGQVNQGAGNFAGYTPRETGRTGPTAGMSGQMQQPQQQSSADQQLSSMASDAQSTLDQGQPPDVKALGGFLYKPLITTGDEQNNGYPDEANRMLQKAISFLEQPTDIPLDGPGLLELPPMDPFVQPAGDNWWKQPETSQVATPWWLNQGSGMAPEASATGATGGGDVPSMV